MTAGSLNHTWSFVPVPCMRFGSTDSYTGRRVFTEATASIYVSRRFFFYFLYEISRSLVLSCLCPIGLIYISDQVPRIQFSISLILAMSIIFMQSKNKRLTFSDYLKVGYFLYTCVVLVLAIQPFDAWLSVIGWGILLLLHVIMIIWLLTSIPDRLRAYSKHRHAKVNSLASVAKELTSGAMSSMVPIHHNQRKVKDIERDQIRSTPYNDDE